MDLWLAYYLVTGLLVGFLAGMLGIGGGAIIVPALTYAFTSKGYSPHAVFHLSLGVSMASIVFTSISSLRAHHQHGAVDWSIVKQMTPGLVAGGFFGTWLARYIPTFPLAVIFCAFIFYVATNMLLNWRPKPARVKPSGTVYFVAGFVICTISALAAVGGAAMTIPFLVSYGSSFHLAVGTAAAVGFPLALSSTIGYIVNGWSVPDLPAGSLGYVYLPALAAITIGTAITAPLGARFAHRSSVTTLKRIFAISMYVVVAKLLHGLWEMS